MSNTIVCPGCGRAVTVDPSTTTRLHCPGCGKSLSRFLPRGSSASAGTRSRLPASNPVMQPAQPRPSGSRPQPVLIGIAILAGLCLLGGAIFVGHSLRGFSGTAPIVAADQPGWEQQHRPEFSSLKADAESRVLAGDLNGGYEKYRQLQQLAGSHPVHDPALLNLIQDARTAQNRVYNLLLTKTEMSLRPSKPATQNFVAANTTTTRSTRPQPASLPSVVIPTLTASKPFETAPAFTPTIPRPAGFAGHEADRQIGAALNRGIGFLISRFANGQINDGRPMDTVSHQGLDALCVYALLHASESSSDPRLSIHGPFMTEAIQVLKSFQFTSDPAKAMSPVVYARSLRAAALAVYDRADDHATLRADVAWLVKAANGGAYTYDDRYANPSSGDLTPLQGMNTPVKIDAIGHGPSRFYPVTLAQSLDDRGTAGPPAPDSSPQQPSPSQQPSPPAGDATGGLYFNTGRLIPFPPMPLPPPPVPTQPPAIYDPLQSDNHEGTGPNSGPVPWDNSNSQYGLLGVWSGAEAGIDVPSSYWKAVEKHWLSCETADGQWFYSNGGTKGTLSMTCAGVASLLVTHEWLDSPALGTRVGRPPYSPGLVQGLKWLETGDDVTDIFTPDLHYLGYTAYGIERCALASGFKFFGNHDWYTEIAARVLPYQASNGSWGRADNGPDALIDTSYLVLFLTRGRQPVMMNKLRVDPYWDNRPRDLANLTRFASRELERPLNWQVVSFERPWSDWMDAPVLYIASHQAMKLTDDDVNKLRSYADAGGLIFTHADNGTAEFNQFAADLARKLWPQYPIQDVPADHELFSVNYHLATPPKLQMVSNGSRLLMVHSPTDLSSAWQERMTRAKKETFQFGVNLFIWSAGRSNFRNRLDSPYIQKPTGSPSSIINVARIKYDGNWDPEPYAWTRFARYFQWTTNIGIKASTVELKDLKPGDAPVAVITGNAPAAFPDADVIAARAYVESGGTLLIDACGGSPAFAHSAEAILLARAFPDTPLKPISATDPLVAGGRPGLDDLSKPLARTYVLDKLDKENAPPVRIMKFGKGRVIYSPLDLTTGLLGTSSWGIAGYTPAYCQAMVKNVLLITNP